MVGHVVAVGPGAEAWTHTKALVPAALPCGDTPFCRAGRAPREG